MVNWDMKLPKGYFSGPVVKYVMPYTDGETGQKAGSAKFAIKILWSGGYLNGTPINVQEELIKNFPCNKRIYIRNNNRN